MPVVPSSSQARAVPAVNAGLLGASGLDGSAVPPLNNLETIIAATVRAVTGQLTGMDGSAADGALLRRTANPAVLSGADMAPGSYAMNRWPGSSADGVGGGWFGETVKRSPSMTTGMPSADAVRSGMLASDNDPNTLYVGNVSDCFICHLGRLSLLPSVGR